MYIVIGADFVPTERNKDLFIKGDKQALVGEELTSVLDSATYRIFNLEVPLTDMEDPIVKQGPNLIAPTAAVAGYKAIGVDLFTLANNHILDQGEQGLKKTVEVLERSNINHVGAGDDLNSASIPFVFSFTGKKIGVYACAEHEFSIASEKTPGANPFDPLWSLDHVEELKKTVDYVIVLYHGGKEHYRYPSPMLQKTCRRLIDKGANLVVCQHSHCIGCEEKYEDGTIVYGQGNFIFDHSNNECWRTSLLLKIDENFKISYIPLVKHSNGVRMADKKKSNEIMECFWSRTKEIKVSNFIVKNYMLFADSLSDYYLRAFNGKRSISSRILNKLTNGKYMHMRFSKIYNANGKIKISNIINCEAHRELLLQAMKNGYESKQMKEV